MASLIQAIHHFETELISLLENEKVKKTTIEKVKKLFCGESKVNPIVPPRPSPVIRKQSEPVVEQPPVETNETYVSNDLTELASKTYNVEFKYCADKTNQKPCMRMLRTKKTCGKPSEYSINGECFCGKIKPDGTFTISSHLNAQYKTIMTETKNVKQQQHASVMKQTVVRPKTETKILPPKKIIQGLVNVSELNDGKICHTFTENEKKEYHINEYDDILLEQKESGGVMAIGIRTCGIATYTVPISLTSYCNDNDIAIKDECLEQNTETVELEENKLNSQFDFETEEDEIDELPDDDDTVNGKEEDEEDELILDEDDDEIDLES
jgi:hypothetical protein